mgnify:CR=1 FL=1
MCVWIQIQMEGFVESDMLQLYTFHLRTCGLHLSENHHINHILYYGLQKLLEGFNACTDEQTTLSYTSMGMYGEVVVEEAGLKW